MFTNLRTRYSRDRKKLKQAKASGSGSDGVSKVKDEAGDMVPYLAWFDPFYKARKTTSNFITVDSENEESEVDEPTNQDDTSPEKENISDIREKGKVSSHVSDDLSSNNFRPHKKSKLHSKAKARMNQDVSTAEVEVFAIHRCSPWADWKKANNRLKFKR